MEMERGFKTGFVLIKLFRGKTVQILFADFMNMKYLMTLVLQVLCRLTIGKSAHYEELPRNFSAPARCILAGNEFGKKWSICKCWAGGETPARAAEYKRAKITRATLSLLLPARPTVFSDV